ncbi:MAG: hypothetical protein KGI46_13015, partial [Alphaproteobacteria bacterium]|nr:hypothetical protein [Alphaproteobacteria bacterium]
MRGVVMVQIGFPASPRRHAVLASVAACGILAGVGGAVAHAGGLPSGGQVVGGSATISQTSATQMQITS